MFLLQIVYVLKCVIFAVIRIKLNKEYCIKYQTVHYVECNFDIWKNNVFIFFIVIIFKIQFTYVKRKMKQHNIKK